MVLMGTILIPPDTSFPIQYLSSIELASCVSYEDISWPSISEEWMGLC